MYVDITDNPSPGSTILSSAIKPLRVSSDADQVRFFLKCQDEIIYDILVYPYNQQVMVYGIADVIENFFRKKNLCVAQISVWAGAVENPNYACAFGFECIYCTYLLPATFDHTKVFLSCIGIQRVPPTAVLTLRCSEMADDAACTVHVAGFNASGKPASAQTSVYAYNSIFEIDIPSIAAFCRDNLSIQSLSMITVEYEGRGKTYVIEHMRDFIEFRFLNFFNCRESMFLQGKLSIKPVSSRQFAVCRGEVEQYDVVPEWTYETHASPLTRPEAVVVAQMAESHDVAVVIDGTQFPIVITDVSPSISSDDSTLCSVTLTWRFKEVRPRIFDSMSGFGIFTHHFTDPFQ